MMPRNSSSKKTARKLAAVTAITQPTNRERLIAKALTAKGEYRETLEAFGLDIPRLDAFACYFGAVFEHSNEPMIVLLSLLERLSALSQLARQGEGTIADVENVIGSLRDRLYMNTATSEDAANDFADQSIEASNKLLAPFTAK